MLGEQPDLGNPTHVYLYDPRANRDGNPFVEYESILMRFRSVVEEIEMSRESESSKVPESTNASASVSFKRSIRRKFELIKN